MRSNHKYLLFAICCCLSFKIDTSVSLLHMRRMQRQVVQPKWLSTGSDGSAAANKQGVKVTPENLREAAAIRASIQKTIDEDTYAVGDGSYVPATPTPTISPFNLPYWPTNWQWPQLPFGAAAQQNQNTAIPASTQQQQWFYGK